MGVPASITPDVMAFSVRGLPPPSDPSLTLINRHVLCRRHLAVTGADSTPWLITEHRWGLVPCLSHVHLQSRAQRPGAQLPPPEAFSPCSTQETGVPPPKVLILSLSDFHTSLILLSFQVFVCTVRTDLLLAGSLQRT